MIVKGSGEFREGLKGAAALVKIVETVQWRKKTT